MKSDGPRLIRDASFELGEGCRFGGPRSDLVCHHSQLPTQPFNVVYFVDRVLCAGYAGRVLICVRSYLVPCSAT